KLSSDSGGTRAAHRVLEYPSLREAKLAPRRRMTPLSIMVRTRRRTSSSSAPTLAPTSAYGLETMGKFDWISFKMARSRSSRDLGAVLRFGVFGESINKRAHQHRSRASWRLALMMVKSFSTLLHVRCFR